MQALDPTTLAQLTADLPPEVLATILRTFKADIARLTGQMVEAAATGDREGFGRGAHGLAGAAGTLGAKRLETLARDALRRQEETPESLLREIQAALSQTITELDEAAGNR